MIRNSLQKYIVIILFASGLSSCARQKNSTEYINADLKDYFNFGVGHYWVFYDSLNNREDSLVVYHVFDELQKRGNISVEHFAINMFDYNSGSINNDEWDLIIENKTSYMYINQTSFNPFTRNFPFDSNIQLTNVQYPYPTSVINNFILHLSVGNILYDSIRLITYRYINNIYNDSFYINRKYGFLKILLNDSFYHKKLYLIKTN